MLDALLLATSLWVSPISAKAVYTEPPAAFSSYAVGFDTWQLPEVWSIPVYTAQVTDPGEPLLYNPEAWENVYNGNWKRSGNSRMTERKILASSSPVFPYPGNVFSSISATVWELPANYNKTLNPPQMRAATFHFNPRMVPAEGPDGHMVVQQPDNTVVETYGTIRLSTGQVVALSYSVSHLASNGDGWENGQTASMLPCYLGLIDDKDAKDDTINHALALTVPAEILATNVAYPAYAFDRNALTQTPAYSGSLPMGTRLALPKDLSLQLYTPEGQAIARAAQKYGAFIVDRGGEGISIRVVHNGSAPDFSLHSYDWPLASDLQQIFANMKVVK